MILWKWEICHPNLAQRTPELRVMDLLSQMALRGHWGLFFFSLAVLAKTPAAPSVLFIKYTVLCSFVCVSKMGWWGFDLQEWETHVTVALRVFVIGTACLVRLRGHSQLLGCSTEMQPDPIPTEQPWSHKQDASDVQLHKCGWPIPVQHKLFFINEFEIASIWNFPDLLSLSFGLFCFEYIEKVLKICLGFQSFSNPPQLKRKKAKKYLS